jgi:DNA-binding transcriptional MocR family regulator
MNIAPTDELVLAWIDRILLDPSVSDLQFRLAALIGNRYVTSRDAPSQRLLAADLGVCIRTIQNALRALETLGHIAVQGSRGETNHYRPIFETAHEFISG